jgi:two-component system LytT family response regulator
MSTEINVPIRVIIVDDEARARRILETLLREYCPGLEVVGHAGSVPEAVREIEAHRPHLVFLDIEMPGDLGFALFDHFSEPDFHVVFTTAYQQYAIQAIKVSALDYLLKPIEIDQLVRAVEKARVQVNSKLLFQQLQAFRMNLNEQRQVSRLALPLADGMVFVNVANILYLKADGSYTHVVTDTNKVLVSKKLGEFEELERHSDFFRTHRSYLVNLRQLERFIKNDGGYLLMRNGDTVELSRNRKEEILEAIKYL